MLLVLLAGLAAFHPFGSVAAANGTETRAEIGGRDVSGAGSGDPLRLDPAAPVEVTVTVTNTGDRPLSVSAVRVEGGALGLTFFSYETVVDFEVEAGAEESRTFPLRLRGLGGQATGLLPARVAVIDQAGETLDEVAFTADVRGSLRSVYGLFGLAVLCFTGLAVAGVLLALARGRLPANRFRRAARFAAAGAGLGLSATFGLSALRVAAPRSTVWLTLFLACSAVAFGVGYLTPHPTAGDERPDDLPPPAEALDTPAPAGGTPSAPTTLVP